MLENTQTMESFMGSFGIVPMTTLKDEGLLSFKNCKDRILDMIKLNIQHFKNDTWKVENRMMGIFSVSVSQFGVPPRCPDQNPINGHKKTPYKSRRNLKLVEVRRVELLTFAMPLQRSTN